MSNPAPFQSLAGGFGIALAVHELLVLNGNVFGISGFIHRAMRGSIEGLAGAAGLVLGGVMIANLEGKGPASFNLSLPQVMLSGFLVGLGTKLANGCTSGHMISGVSRLSIRSIVASVTFFTTGVITTRIFHGDSPPASAADWSLGARGAWLLTLQVIPFCLTALLYLLHVHPIDNSKKCEDMVQALKWRPTLRVITYIATSFQFALALRLSNLSESKRVFAFLLLPFHHAFDPSLAFLAGSALPLSIFLYRYAIGSHALFGKLYVPKGTQIDTKLLIGSAIFGIGWGLAGICPGPGLVNFGRALGSGGRDLTPYATWLGSMAAGGLLA